ncbi:hypothetical protein M407DRAFT_245627, partial [Tulasnella calospora MUT 4182]
MLRKDQRSQLSHCPRPRPLLVRSGASQQNAKTHDDPQNGGGGPCKARCEASQRMDIAVFFMLWDMKRANVENGGLMGSSYSHRSYAHQPNRTPTTRPCELRRTELGSSSLRCFVQTREQGPKQRRDAMVREPGIELADGPCGGTQDVLDDRDLVVFPTQRKDAPDNFTLQITRVEISRSFVRDV